MIRNHNWDVCPDWAKFSSDRCERRKNISVVENIRQDEGDERDHFSPAEVINEVIPFPNGNHINKGYTRR